MENLQQVSTEVLSAMVEECKRKWSCYAPLSLECAENGSVCVYGCNGGKIECFNKPNFQDWDVNDGLGKALKALVKDPGMHESARLYGKRELSELCEMTLCDFEGVPTELGKKVYNAIMEK